MNRLTDRYGNGTSRQVMECSHWTTPTPTKWVCNPFACVGVGVEDCVGVGQYGHLHTILYNPFFIGVGVGQYEHSISDPV